MFLNEIYCCLAVTIPCWLYFAQCYWLQLASYVVPTILTHIPQWNVIFFKSFALLMYMDCIFIWIIVMWRCCCNVLQFTGEIHGHQNFMIVDEWNVMTVAVWNLVVLRVKHKSPCWSTYEACPESKDTTVLNMYSIFNLQKRHCDWMACT